MNKPPYPKTCRKNQNNLYTHEMITQDHTRLLNVARSLPEVSTLISSYPNQLYLDALSDWSTTTFQSQTRNGAATEQVWFNYPKPTELHDYRYIGNNYRERELIKGKILRNVSKLNKMPADMRNAILSQINS